MSKKLQNVKAVREMLQGTHKFQTKKSIGFSDVESSAKQSEKHAVGDVWEEHDPATNTTHVLEQRDGFRIKKSKLTDTLQAVRDEIRSFPNCRKETCTCSGKHPVDKKMQKIHGMCFDCTIDMEHELKKAGEFDAYEKNKIRENALAWLASAERDVAMLKEAYTTATKFVTNSEGEKESWSAKMTPEEFEETVQKQFDIFKENFLNKLNKENNNETN
jgi:hemerythrin-like domain-containing protein